MSTAQAAVPVGTMIVGHLRRQGRSRQFQAILPLR
jgi:hypothetical protein